MVKVSVVTPSYNQGQFIEATIQSVLTQSTPADEYIIIDGCSTDNTLPLLQNYQNKISIISEKDNGQTEALNKGFKLAQHEIIAWLNSDDLYTKDTIAIVKACFSADPSLDIVYGNALFIDVHGKSIGHYPVAKQISPSTLWNECVLCQPAVFFKKNLFERYGYLNTNLKFGMDYEFWLRLLNQQVKFYFVPQILAKQRLHQFTKTAVSSVDAHKETCDLIYQYSGKLPAHQALAFALAFVPQNKKNIQALKQLINNFKMIKNRYHIHYTLSDTLRSIYHIAKKIILKAFDKCKIISEYFFIKK